MRKRKQQDAAARKQQQQIELNASKIAAKYKRRCWWASYEDIKQEAIRAQLEAARNREYDPSEGNGYLWMAGTYAARKFVHKASAPVSASHRTEKLIGLYRAPLEFVGESGAKYDHPKLQEQARAVNPEESLAREELVGRVRKRVVELVGAEAAAFAVYVMSHEWRPREAAEANGVPVRNVYVAQKQIAQVLRCDPQLRALWKESVG